MLIFKVQDESRVLKRTEISIKHDDIIDIIRNTPSPNDSCDIILSPATIPLQSYEDFLRRSNR
jgi:hypothetical protein